MKLSDWLKNSTCCWRLSHRRLLQAAAPHPGDDCDNDDHDVGGVDDDDGDGDHCGDDNGHDVGDFDDDHDHHADDAEFTWSVSNVCLSSVVSTFKCLFVNEQ